MQNIKPGQRWISTAEPELGLGTILRADNRQSDIVFTGCGELKHFTHTASPLLRVQFEAGDWISVDGQSLYVSECIEREGIAHYLCAGTEYIEGRIDPEQPALPAAMRLRVNQCDSGHCFDLRHDALRLEQLDKDAFEHFALALLGHFGIGFKPLPGHCFQMDTQTSQLQTAVPEDALFAFDGEQSEENCQIMDKSHPLLQEALKHILDGGLGNACFMVDDSLPARSAVMQTLFAAAEGCQLLAIDAVNNILPNYRPGEQALYRSQHARIDLQPYKRSLERMYPLMLERSMQEAQAQGLGKLLALRLVVGAEFALFGRNPR